MAVVTIYLFSQLFWYSRLVAGAIVQDHINTLGAHRNSLLISFQLHHYWSFNIQYSSILYGSRKCVNGEGRKCLKHNKNLTHFWAWNDVLVNIFFWLTTVQRERQYQFYSANLGYIYISTQVWYWYADTTPSVLYGAPSETGCSCSTGASSKIRFSTMQWPT